MKIKAGAICLLVFFIQGVNSQNSLSSPLEGRITLEVVNMPVQKVLRQIEKQTNLHFVYNSRITEGLKPVTVSFRNRKITEIISFLFENKIRYKIKDNYIILFQNDRADPSAVRHSPVKKSENDKNSGKQESIKDTVDSSNSSKSIAESVPAPVNNGNSNKTDSLSVFPGQLRLINDDTTLLLLEEDTASVPK